VDVSKERVASIFKVEESAKPSTNMKEVTSIMMYYYLAYSSAPKMEAMLVDFKRAAKYYISEL
jgi:hypothetical protein